MSTHSYTEAELGGGPIDLNDYNYKTQAAGYTLNPGWIFRNDQNGALYYCTVDEVVDKATLLADTQAQGSMPSLSASPKSGTLTGDGVDTLDVTISDSRGAAAAGKVVTINLPPAIIPISPGHQLTLNGSGYATLTVGPVTGCSGPLPFQAFYENGEADPVAFTVACV